MWHGAAPAGPEPPSLAVRRRIMQGNSVAPTPRAHAEPEQPRHRVEPRRPARGPLTRNRHGADVRAALQPRPARDGRLSRRQLQPREVLIRHGARGLSALTLTRARVARARAAAGAGVHMKASVWLQRRMRAGERIGRIRLEGAGVRRRMHVGASGAGAVRGEGHRRSRRCVDRDRLDRLSQVLENGRHVGLILRRYMHACRREARCAHAGPDLPSVHRELFRPLLAVLSSQAAWTCRSTLPSML